MDYVNAGGVAVPALGLGTWDLRGEQCVEVVLRAIELGYTHIDTAWMYENQGPIGRAVRYLFGGVAYFLRNLRPRSTAGTRLVY